MDEPKHDCLLMKHINEAASACINKSQRLICGHLDTYLHLQYSSLHTTNKPLQYIAETRVHFYTSELRFLVSRVRSLQCLSTCASVCVC